ncbi:MAG TPA: F0F1 ATP synthase subunit B [Nitrospinota bacterium]|nr:F0F1 ATP synthase subunit B [Nitrospinota bacterium]|tara:strand:+ start:76849 stop:77280 length:432 start_codon:yes stop_codon:yes gene_type:complete
MIDVDFTLFIQATNFIIILWFLNKFIFKPVLKHTEMRDEKINEIEDCTSSFVKLGEEALTKYQQELANIRREASETISKARDEALIQQDKLTDNAKLEFKRLTDNAYNDIKNEADLASTSLNVEINDFAHTLAEKILNRKIIK